MVWQNRNMRNHFNSCVLWDGHLFGFDDSKLTCISAATGDVKWVADGYGKGSLMMADGKLIVLGENGLLAVAPASPDGFEPTVRASVLDGQCWTMPVLSGKRIYCRNTEGTLKCLDVRP